MKESVNGIRSHVTTDGIIRNPQVTPATLDAEVWDGRRNSYIPRNRLRIDHRLQLHQEADLTVDPITYQVLRSRLWQKNLEHGDVLQRVSGSVPVVYSRDYATGLLTETGDIVVTSPTIQFFSGLSDLIVMWTLENRSAEPGIEDGDVFLQNDPYIAAPQQSDTAVYAPIFWDGKLFCWVLNVMHVGDLGGVDPGGWAINARDIFDEGIVVPPIRIATRGQVQWELIQMFARQSREPDFVILNAKSALAGIASTRRQIEEMLDEFGAAAVKGVMRRMIANCSKTFSARLMEIPDGTWSERLYVTGAMPGERTTHHEILSITKRGDQVICSNRGTSPQGGAGNSTYAFLRSSIVAALSTALAFDQLGCAAGVANHVVLEPEAGTRNVARHPAAASAHLSTFVTVNLAALVTSKMMLSAPQDLRARAHASGGLAMPLADVIFGIGQDGRMIGNPASCAQALLGGCIGAFPFRDGVDSGASWWLLETSAGNVEESGQSGVALVLYRSETRDSGGPGRGRGGNSLTAAWTPHKTFMAMAQMTFVDPSTNSAAGLCGGYFGLGGNFLRSGNSRVGESIREGKLPATRADVEQIAGPMQRLHPKAAIFPVPRGDCIAVEFNGAGGFGDPLDREPQSVSRDIQHEKISREGALRHWGVVVSKDGNVDEDATAGRRAAIRAERRAEARRLEGAGSRLGPAIGHRVLLPGAGGQVDVSMVGHSTFWTCSHCAEVLGPITENFKHCALYREKPPHQVDAHMYGDPAEFGDPEIVLRQYFCPGCATLIAQEFCRRGDEPLHDFRIEDARLGSNV